SGEQVNLLVRLAIAVTITNRGQVRSVHDIEGSAVERYTLDGIEARGEHRRPIGIAVAVGILCQADFAAANDLGAQAGHVVDGHEQRTGPRPESDDRWIFNQRIAGEKVRLEAGRHLERRKAFFGSRADLRQLLARAFEQRWQENESNDSYH